MKCVVIHNDTQEEGTEPLYSRSLRKKGPAEISAGPFWVTEPVEVTSLYTDCGLYYVYYQMISYLSLVGLR